jgi:hypothetical protein
VLLKSNRAPGHVRFPDGDLVMQPELSSSCPHGMAAQSIMGGL